jgi:membrane protease subunit HflC
MNRALLAGGVVAVLALIVIAFSSLFIVDQTSQALVIQFGRPVREVRDPGLHVKAPWQSAVFYERRLLDLEPVPESVTLSDQNKLLIDAYARYRIVNALQFYQKAGTEARFQQNLGLIISGTLYSVLGTQPLSALLSQDRDKVISDVSSKVSEQAKPFGVEIVDVRIRRADLPQENSQAIYARMRSERQREANEYRAQGAEQAQGIRARAERDRTVILAEAAKQAQILRGHRPGYDHGAVADQRVLPVFRPAQAAEGGRSVTPDGLRDLWTSLALVLVIEGALYALFPQLMKRALLSVIKQPESLLRVCGLVSACLGVGWVWFLRHH